MQYHELQEMQHCWGDLWVSMCHFLKIWFVFSQYYIFIFGCLVKKLEFLIFWKNISQGFIYVIAVEYI